MKNFKKIFVAMMIVVLSVVGIVALAGCSKVTPVVKELEGYEAEEFGLFVKKGNTALVEKINAFLATEGTIDKFNQSKDYHIGKEGAKPLTLPNLEDNTGVTYTMVTEAGYAPYEVASTGEGSYKGYKGCDVDLMVLFCEYANAKLEIKNLEFNALPKEVNKSEFNIGAAGMTISDDRKEVNDFSNPYESSQQVIISSEEDGFSKIDQLAGKKVGVQGGTTAQISVMKDALAKGGKLEGKGTEVKAYDKIVVAFNDLKSGRLDAIVIDKLVAENLIKFSK